MAQQRIPIQQPQDQEATSAEPRQRTGKDIIDAMQAAVSGNISRVNIEGQTWVRMHDNTIQVPKGTLADLGDLSIKITFATHEEVLKFWHRLRGV